MYKLLFFVLLLLLTSNINAQQELGLHFMHSVLQSAKTNPAFLPKDRIIVGLPNGYFNLFHTSGTINDILNTNTDGPTDVDVMAWVDLLKEQNLLNTHLELETFQLVFGFDKFTLGLTHAVKFNTLFDYPDKYIQLLGQGNAQFVGQTIEFGPDLNMEAYNEFGLGMAYYLSDKLTIGGKVKFLTGIGSVETIKSDATLFTDEDIYQLEINTDYSINATRLLTYDEGFELHIPSFGGKELFSGNTGIAIDLGIQFQVNDKLSLAASITDLGQISWKEDAFNYSSNITENYEGIVIDFPALLRGESANFSSDADSIDFDNLFEFQQSNSSYTTSLPAKLYLSAGYRINDRVDVGGMFYSEFYKGNSKQAFAVSVSTRLIDQLIVGATYAWRQEDFANVGLNVVANLGPVQIFAVTDNILAAIQPYDKENVNGRVGVNFLLDKIWNPKKEAASLEEN